MHVCGDWEPFKNEKCFKFLSVVSTEDEAKTTCYQLDRTSTLIDIESGEEQDFVSSRVNRFQSMSDKVWLGMNMHELVLNPFNGKKRYVIFFQIKLRKSVWIKENNGSCLLEIQGHRLKQNFYTVF